MIKFKLLEARKRKKLTQEYMADALFMSVSNYSRRERGHIKMNGKEWQKLADLLGVHLEQIYEPDDEIVTAILEKSDTSNIYGTPCGCQMFYELQKCIEKIEAELRKAQKEIEILKIRNSV